MIDSPPFTQSIVVRRRSSLWRILAWVIALTQLCNFMRLSPMHNCSRMSGLPPFPRSMHGWCHYLAGFNTFTRLCNFMRLSPMHNFITPCEIDLSGLLWNIFRPNVHSVNQPNKLLCALGWTKVRTETSVAVFLPIDTMVVGAGGIVQLYLRSTLFSTFIWGYLIGKGSCLKP